jgi:mannose-1-phosphate guanylyltransferase
MLTHDHTWAVVLAAGEGTRLHSLTMDAIGRPVPKQYCSLFGGPTLLQDALRRGLALTGRKRLCAIVATQHIEWWRATLWALPPDNVIVQPGNRGTAVGVLLSVLSIQAMDPFARIAFLPADHFVENETRLRSILRVTLKEVKRGPDDVLLVGVRPDSADSDLGYIVPHGYLGKARRVARFVEKPPAPVAAALVDVGALWNSFIFAATGATLLAIFRERIPEVVELLEAALASAQPAALEELYATLPELDFSRDVLTGAERRLRVVPAHGCGWTDLGTPGRVGDLLRRNELESRRPPIAQIGTPAAPINLAAAYRRPEREIWPSAMERPS